MIVRVIKGGTEGRRDGGTEGRRSEGEEDRGKGPEETNMAVGKGGDFGSRKWSTSCQESETSDVTHAASGGRCQQKNFRQSCQILPGLASW
eukprot:768414-Hanusia_phi.AAC.3